MTHHRHLTRETIVDVLDGRVTDAVRAHLDACPACRTRVDDAGAAWALARDVEVPEPSPLFWDHLSARVSAAVAEESAAPVSGWRLWWHRRWLMGGVAAAAALVILAVVVPRPGGPQPAVGSAVPAAATTVNGADAAGLQADLTLADDEGWAVVAALSDELAADAQEAAALEPAPGLMDRAVGTLDADEQHELVRLLEAELARRPS